MALGGAVTRVALRNHLQVQNPKGIMWAVRLSEGPGGVLKREGVPGISGPMTPLLHDSYRCRCGR